MLNYTEKPQNTYIQSSMVTEILAREKCEILWCLRTVYSHGTARPQVADRGTASDMEGSCE